MEKTALESISTKEFTDPYRRLKNFTHAQNAHIPKGRVVTVGFTNDSREPHPFSKVEVKEHGASRDTGELTAVFLYTYEVGKEVNGRDGFIIAEDKAKGIIDNISKGMDPLEAAARQQLKDHIKEGQTLDPKTIQKESQTLQKKLDEKLAPTKSRGVHRTPSRQGRDGMTR